MDQNTAQERTEQPTPKRLRESAEKGEVARSRELTTALLLLAGTGAIYLAGATVVRDINTISRSAMSFGHADIMDEGVMGRSLADAIGQAIAALSPVLIVVACVAILAPMALSGWSFSSKAITSPTRKPEE